MDCDRLKINIPTARSVYDDGSGPVTQYFIRVQYGQIEWEARHRFSDFLKLATELEQQGIFALPEPPAKHLGRLNNPSQIEERRLLLQTWLLALVERPDVITSSTMQDFIELGIHTGITAATSLKPQLEAEGSDPRLHVGDFCLLSHDAILASYEEAASLARVGKVWSLVDVENLGAVSLWRLATKQRPTEEQNKIIKTTTTIQPSLLLPPPIRNERCFTRVIQMPTPHRARTLFYHPTTERIFIGQENGSVLVLGFPDGDSCSINNYSQTTRNQQDIISSSLFTFIRRGILPLHSEAVLSLSGHNYENGRLLSIGFDNCVRVIDCTTFEPVTGGKLSRRLGFNEHLTLGTLDSPNSSSEADASRAFVSTSQGRIFIYGIASAPPSYLGTISCEPANFISALKLVGVSLLVGHGRVLSIFRVGNPVEYSPDNIPQRIASFSLDATSGRTIRSIAVARTAPLMFLGHSGGCISIWDCNKHECVSAFRAHSGAAKQIEVLESYSDIHEHEALSSVGLISGGSDGYLRLWRCGPSSSYRRWRQDSN